MKYFYFKGFKIFGTFVLIFLVLLSCKKGKNEGPNGPGNTVTSPYEDPVWHPAGNIIGFNYTPLSEIIYYPGGMNQIFKPDSTGFWLVNSDGTAQRRMLPYKLLKPKWSPDGKWIATSIEGQIFKIPFDGEKFDEEGKIMLTSTGRNFNPSWSPDGEWIAYDSNADSPSGYFIWKMDKNGNLKRRILYTPTDGSKRSPSWSNDSRIIYLGQEIFSMDTAGNDVKKLISTSFQIQSPKVSSHGGVIGFISVNAFIGDNLQLYIADQNGGNLKKLSTSGVWEFSWSPSGRIVYQSFDGKTLDKTKGTLWTMDADGNNKKPLTYNTFKITK